MRVTIEDLEALKELNDELEENHVETERSLNEEIGISNRHGISCIALTSSSESKDTNIRELDARVESLEESCQDLELTIVRFRELVMQLQTYSLVLRPPRSR